MFEWLYELLIYGSYNIYCTAYPQLKLCGCLKCAYNCHYDHDKSLRLEWLFGQTQKEQVCLNSNSYKCRENLRI